MNPIPSGEETILDRQETSPNTFAPQRKQYIHQVIANYLVRAGFMETAAAFAKESGVHPTLDCTSFATRDTIIETIRSGHALEAIRLMDHHFPGLLQVETFVKFQLLQLHLLGLIRAGTTKQAVDFAQTLPLQIEEYCPRVQSEIQSTMALLAFDNPDSSPFGTLLHQGQRVKVALAVNGAILERTNQELPNARKEQLFKTILWAQAELQKRNIWFPKMRNFVTAIIES